MCKGSSFSSSSPTLHAVLKSGLSAGQLGVKGIAVILEEFSGNKGMLDPLFGKGFLG